MSFDRLAPHYHWIEWLVFGRSLQRCRTAHLYLFKHSRKILIVGGGDGRFLAELFKSNPDASIDWVDVSPAMRSHATRRAGDMACRVQFTMADIRHDALPSCDYDTVFTHFLLDCFEGEVLREVVARVGDSVAVRGHWVVGDFGLPRKPSARRRALSRLGIMYAFFRVASRLTARRLEEPDSQMVRFGFRKVEERLWQDGFIHSRVWQRID